MAQESSRRRSTHKTRAFLPKEMASALGEVNQSWQEMCSSLKQNVAILKDINSGLSKTLVEKEKTSDLYKVVIEDYKTEVARFEVSWMLLTLELVGGAVGGDAGGVDAGGGAVGGAGGCGGLNGGGCGGGRFKLFVSLLGCIP